MQRIFGLSLTLVLILASPASPQQRGLSVQNASTEQRVALVIGNGAYKTAPLNNPVHDAQDIAQALRELGFDVIYKENQSQNDMKRAIRAFGEKLRGGGVGLFYYAGHGVQVKGINYLVPVDAKVESEEEVEYEAVEAGFVLAQMESAKNSLNIVILDACRNNPFARSFRSASRGLATISAPSGTLVAYATAPGSVASDGTAHNGLYTQELLKFMRTPGLGIENVFKQVRISVLNQSKGKQTPWESSSLVGDFYFTKKAAPELSEAERTCLNEPKLRATEPVPLREIRFTLTNESKETIVAYWLDYEGKRQHYFDLAPNQKTEQPTYITHPWVITTKQGKCLRILFAPGNYEIR